MTSLDLSGKRVLVTGASRGIGRPVSLELFGNGAKVGAHYNANGAEALQLRAADKQIHLYQAYLSSAESTA